MIEVINLVKKYGDHTAVKNISFKVDTGKIYGFLGPNGAGKSTTMNIMTGCLAATDGRVVINGHDIYRDPIEAKKCIGYLPELPPVYPDMTPYEYLRFVGKAKGVKKDELEEQIKDIMEMTGIDKVSHRLIKHLSKGYRQRVGLAQAIVGFPEIIILDEPMVGLDPKQIIEIRELIRELGKKHTVFLSSHILSEVSAVCDYIMIISDGRLVASDTPDNLSKMLKGNVLQLSVKGAKESVTKAFSKLKDVTNITVTESGEEGIVDVEIESKNDVRSEVFFALCDARLPIMSLSSNRLSLENIFLELTEKKDDGKNIVDDIDDDDESGEEYTPLFTTDLKKKGEK
ncbi:MAG: ATP-binding cassette domain-containing protein [Clostridia bacterium]|nr:ATP-binding cassette domain-containing protein [Clostridia bacterium]